MKLFLVGGAPHVYVLGFNLLLFGIEIFPRFPKEKASKLDRQEFPNLYKLMDMISEKLNCERIKYLCVNYDFNAYFTTSGIKKDNFVVLGIPFLSIMDINEKISVIAHEVAHCKNRDISRHWFIKSAANSLSNWHEQLAYFGRLIFLRPITWPLSLIVKVLVNILGLLIWRDRQKAEYYADYQAAKIAGVDATISSSKKFYFHPSFFKTLEQVVRFNNTKELFEIFRKQINNVPEREIQRVNVIEQLETSKIQSSHPPTLLRNQYISSKVTGCKILDLDSDEIKQIEIEFKRIEEMVQKRLLSDYREYNLYEYYGR